MSTWTEKELLELKSDYGRLLPLELEIKYKRKYSTIRNTAARYSIFSNRELKTCNKGALKWTLEEENEFKNDWTNRMISSSEITKKYGRSYESLKNKAKSLRINRRINVNGDAIAKLYRSGHSSSLIAKNLNISSTSTLKILKKEKINIRSRSESHRKYNRDSNYFEKINNSEKAYWLGFLYADGCIRKNELSLGLKGADYNHVAKLKECLKMEADVKIVNTKCSNKNYNVARVTLKDSKLCNDLKKLGCHERKSFILKFPKSNQVSNVFMKAFISGYFDGDGCISESRNKDRYTISFVGTENIISGIKSYLNIPNKISSRGNVFTIAITSQHGVLNFINDVYSHSPINLERKKEIAKRCKNFYESKRRNKKTTN